MPISFKSLGAVPAKIQKTDVIKSTQSWTVPADVTSIEVILCGGGGGGTHFGNSGITAGFGGSGSAELANLSVTPGSSHTITIGAGGAATAAQATPIAGGSSSFGSLLTVAGGYSMTYGGNNGATWTNLSGLPGGKNGGKGSRYFSKQGNGDSTNGAVFFVPSEKGIGGVGGGGGIAAPYFASTSTAYFWNINGSDGGGSGGFKFYGPPWGFTGATAGAANTGGGGGGGTDNDGFASSNAANGGSGVCIIKYWSAL